uniref:Uncharacterized protein n=1 Tax=Leersia perrieri TaxID=77586 RepID=A0A0D9WM89_9ORYZ
MKWCNTMMSTIHLPWKIIKLTPVLLAKDICLVAPLLLFLLMLRKRKFVFESDEEEDVAATGGVESSISAPSPSPPPLKLRTRFKVSSRKPCYDDLIGEPSEASRERLTYNKVEDEAGSKDSTGLTGSQSGNNVQETPAAAAAAAEDTPAHETTKEDAPAKDVDEAKEDAPDHAYPSPPNSLHPNISESSAGTRASTSNVEPATRDIDSTAGIVKIVEGEVVDLEDYEDFEEIPRPLAIGTTNDSEASPLEIKWTNAFNREECIILNSPRELEEREMLAHRLDQASVHMERIYKRSLAKDRALRKLAPVIAETESLRKERDGLLISSRAREIELLAELNKLRDENFELRGSLGTSSTKVSQLQEATRRAEETIKAITKDYTNMENEFEGNLFFFF